MVVLVSGRLDAKIGKTLRSYIESCHVPSKSILSITEVVTQMMTDEQLLNELRAGQADAFRKLVELHQRKVINICYRFVHDQAEAEDLAQETFIEVHRSIRRFKGKSSLSTWIHSIAVSKSLDLIRHQSREKRGGKLRALLRLDDAASNIPAPDSAQPDEVLKQRERRQVLQQALAALPEKQHIAFVLSKYDGLTYQEIAETMGTTVSSVESLIHRAKSNLQKRLRTYYEGTFRSE